MGKNIYEVMVAVTELFEQFKSEQEIDKLAEIIIANIEGIKKMSKEYLKAGIL